MSFSAKFLKLIRRYSAESKVAKSESAWLDFEFLRRKKKYDPFYDSTVYGAKPRTKFGGKYLIPMAKGTGSGPEMMDAVIQVFESMNAPVQFSIYDIKGTSSEEEFMHFIHGIRKCGACIKAFIESPKDDDQFLSRNMRLRVLLRLFANLMHLRSFPGLPTKGKEIDIILIRQNTEGEYSLLEHKPTPSIIENLKIVSKYRTEHLAKFVFEVAKRSNRRRVLCVYVEGCTPKLFVETIATVSKDYPDIEFVIRTTTGAMHNIITQPEKEDVVVIESLYGGVIANCVFGMLGSPGLIAGCNYGNRYAMFEPSARSKARSIAGKGIVNPTAALLSGAELLKYLECCYEAKLLEDAVLETLQCDHIFTPDLGGKATTEMFVRNVINRIRDKTKRISFCSLDDPPLPPSLPTTPTPPYDPSYYEEALKMSAKEEYKDDKE